MPRFLGLVGLASLWNLATLQLLMLTGIDGYTQSVPHTGDRPLSLFLLRQCSAEQMPYESSVRQNMPQLLLYYQTPVYPL